MTTTYTPSLRFAQPGVGDPNAKNVWGALLNTDMALIEAAITGVSTIDLTGQSSLTLTSNNGAADQSRPFALNFINTPAGGTVVTLPPLLRFGLVQNAGPGSVTLQAAVFDGAAMMSVYPDACWVWYYCDGTNVNPILRSDAMGNQAIITATQTLTVPPSVRIFRVRAWASGGNGGPGNGAAGGGGGGGGYAETLFPVIPGQVYTASLTTGSGVQFQLPGASPIVEATSGANGGPGAVAPASTYYLSGGLGKYGQITSSGQSGSGGFQIYSPLTGNPYYRGGPGGDAGYGGGPGGGEVVAGNSNGYGGSFPGGGGSGGVGTGQGGPGAAGLIMVYW